MKAVPQDRSTALHVDGVQSSAEQSIYVAVSCVCVEWAWLLQMNLFKPRPHMVL